jgi:ankyrin repeat protein
VFVSKESEEYEEIKENIRKHTCSESSEHMVHCCSSDNLHYASEHGNLEIAKFVLENGVEVDVRNKFDETPMMART